MRKKVAIALGFSALFVGLVPSAAFAGEVNGAGTKHYFSQGKSACKFSGLNDTPDAPAPEGGRTQTYGQLVRQGLKADFPSPGVACNPNTPAPPEEG